MSDPELHVPYQELLRLPHDFVVRYRYYSPEEGGRYALPVQGIRSDFRYVDQKLNGTGVWMIWPEFEDEKGELILDRATPVPVSGTARMWIINPERRSFHQSRIAIGTKAYFMEGRPVAECEVIAIVGLMENSTKNQKQNVGCSQTKQ